MNTFSASKLALAIVLTGAATTGMAAGTMGQSDTDRSTTLSSERNDRIQDKAGDTVDTRATGTQDSANWGTAGVDERDNETEYDREALSDDRSEDDRVEVPASDEPEATRNYDADRHEVRDSYDVSDEPSSGSEAINDNRSQ